MKQVIFFLSTHYSFVVLLLTSPNYVIINYQPHYFKKCQISGQMYL